MNNLFKEAASKRSAGRGASKRPKAITREDLAWAKRRREVEALLKTLYGTAGKKVVLLDTPEAVEKFTGRRGVGKWFATRTGPHLAHKNYGYYFYLPRGSKVTLPEIVAAVGPDVLFRTPRSKGRVGSFLLDLAPRAIAPLGAVLPMHDWTLGPVSAPARLLSGGPLALAGRFAR